MADITEDFAGRVALITGAARGLGAAMARRFLERGARVAVNVRDESRAASLERALGPGAFGVAGDVANGEDVRAMVERTVERFQRIDVLVNNAAVARPTRFERIAEDEWRQTIDVNLTGAFLCIQAVVAPMKANRYGRIVNVSSTAGKSVSTLAGAHYTASKAGLLGLTRAAAKELGVHGITVNAICPGLIDTELTRENATPSQLQDHVRDFRFRGWVKRSRWRISSVSSRPSGPVTSRGRRWTSTEET